MLGGLFGSYHFPHLAWVEAVKLHKDRDDTTNIYVLDWSRVDELNSRVARTSEEDYSLPDKWKKMAEGPFAITPEYYKAISHFSQIAMQERVPRWNFDTMMRDICIEPSIAAANTAFKLLNDCSYDKDTGFYARGPERKAREYVMRYYFWLYQTGTGLVKDHAGIDKMDWWIWHLGKEDTVKDAASAKEMKSFSTFVNYQLNKLEDGRRIVKGESAPTGPSIEPEEATGFNYDYVVEVDPGGLEIINGKLMAPVDLENPGPDMEVYGMDDYYHFDCGVAWVPMYEDKVRFNRDDEWATVESTFNGGKVRGYFRPYYEGVKALKKALTEDSGLEVAKDICVDEEDLVVSGNGMRHAYVRVDKDFEFSVWHHHKVMGEKIETSREGKDIIKVPLWSEKPLTGRWIRVSAKGKGDYSPGSFGYFKPRGQKIEMFLDSM